MKFKRIFKLKIANRILIYGFITWLQRMKGITSKTGREGYHYILLDYDNTPFYIAKESLEKLMVKYSIDGFVIFSDKEDSFRLFSDTIVDFKQLLRIMLDAEGLDRMFFKWTVIRGYATIRISDKKNRLKKNNIVGAIGKANIDFAREKLKFIEYETDLEDATKE